MSSKSTPVARGASVLAFFGSIASAWCATAALTETRMPPERALEVISVSAEELSGLWGCSVDRVAAWSCDRRCVLILSQVDERDRMGRWALDFGTDDSEEEQRGSLDQTDWVLAQVTDLGQPAPVPPSEAAYAVRVSDPSATFVRWLYLGCRSGAPIAGAQRDPRVSVEPQLDLVRMRRISVGFSGAFPDRLLLNGEQNLLDRLKLRAEARFLFGLLGVRRDESHLQGRVLGWRIGPLRAIRAQEQWVYLGWGIRTPVFRSYAMFYPDYLDIPVSLRLRFPATHFFSAIRIQGYVDFRDLRGWSLLLPDDPVAYFIDGRTTPQEKALAVRNPQWFALRGPDLTFVQYFGLSPSLHSVTRRFLYRDDIRAAFPPEAVPGEVPGVGYELTHWQGVGSGVHSLHATSFVVPSTLPPEQLIAAQRQPLTIQVQPLQ